MGDMAQYYWFVYIPFVGCFVSPVLAFIHTTRSKTGLTATIGTNDRSDILIKNILALKDLNLQDVKVRKALMSLSDKEINEHNMISQITFGLVGNTPPYKRRLNLVLTEATARSSYVVESPS